jgi:hypothetical protein
LLHFCDGFARTAAQQGDIRTLLAVLLISALLIAASFFQGMLDTSSLYAA